MLAVCEINLFDERWEVPDDQFTFKPPGISPLRWADRGNMNNFVKGLLFGTGFGIGILAIALLTVFVLYISPIRFGETESSIVGTDALVIQDHRINFNEGKPIISGTLRNSTDTTLSKVIVEGSIFDEDQCFIDKADEYFESIFPKDKIGFKISFYDWERSTDNKKFDYKVRIKQGYDKE